MRRGSVEKRTGQKRIHNTEIREVGTREHPEKACGHFIWWRIRVGTTGCDPKTVSGPPQSKRALGGEVGQDFGGVAFGFYVVPGLFDFPVCADEVGDARDALEGAAHEFFQTPGAVGEKHFVRGIAEQREIQFLFGFKVG